MSDPSVILAISTSTPAVSVAVLVDGEVAASSSLVRERQHVEALVPLIDDVLVVAKRAWSDVTLVAVDVGPGLFTGIRVGVVTGAALAASRGLLVAGVTSIEALAASVAAVPDQRAWVAVDGRRGDVFLARAQDPGAFEVVTYEQALDRLASERASVVVGDGVVPLCAAAKAAGREMEWRAGEASQMYPDAAVLAGVAHSRVTGDPRAAIHASELRPVYGREADAVANFSTRLDG